MLCRYICGLLVAAVLGACSNSDSAGSSVSSTPKTGATAGPRESSVLFFRGTPAGSATIDGTYTFRPMVMSNGRPLTFAIAGQPKWANFDTSTGILSGKPLASDSGLTGNITITASDGEETASVGPFVIRVVEANAPDSPGAPPLISGTPAGAVTAGQSYTFQPAASDAGGAPLTYAIINCPVWASFSTSTGKLSGTPGATQVGTYSNIEIAVTDGSAIMLLPEFSILVTASTPDMPHISGTPASSILAGLEYSFEPTIANPESRPLKFSIAHAPSWAMFDTATGKLTGTPTIAQAGLYSNILISVSNGVSSAVLPAFAITVTSLVVPENVVIAGSPATAGVVGRLYSFQPSARDPAGGHLVFSIVNRPQWAAFDPASGHLVGTPTSKESGSYPNITISVASARSTAALPPFDLVISPVAVTKSTNGTAELTWIAPRQNTDGSPIISLAGYRIYYGTNAGAMTQVVQINDPRVLSFELTNLASGTWYFEARAYTAMNAESSASDVVSKIVN